MSKALLIAGLLGLAAATPSPWKQPKQKQCPYLKAIPVNATVSRAPSLHSSPALTSPTHFLASSSSTI